MKSGELLKDQNAKKSRSDKKAETKKKIEDQIFDAYKDPVDGNFYLQVDPDDLDKFSMEELEVLNSQFQEHVELEKLKDKYKTELGEYEVRSSQEQSENDTTQK
jgi:hypothetical protein